MRFRAAGRAPRDEVYAPRRAGTGTAVDLHRHSGRHRPAAEEHLRERLDELANELRVPHDDAEERRRRQQAAERAGENRRREGKGIHPGGG